MSLFSKRKDLAVQSFVLKMVNNHCPGRTALLEGPRNDSRVNLTVVVMIVPVVDGQLQVRRTLSAVTKEFSNAGVAVVLDQPLTLHEVVLGFSFENQMTFVRATAKHLDPMGGGFCQLGFQLTEVVSPLDYPELESVRL